MRYLLAVLTHGDNADTLARTIESFDRHVWPPPNHRLVVQDGPCALPPVAPYGWSCLTLPRPQGFCAATRALWTAAAATDDVDYVFWLEHDFDFLRAVNVEAMAALLDADDLLAQVSLMRQPCNDDEAAAGGVVAAMRARGHDLVVNHSDVADVDYVWHDAYFTTNPSLMTRAFMAENPWPSYEAGCEGRYGLQLRGRGYQFAIMGDGDPWVEHVGVRTGKGY